MPVSGRWPVAASNAMCGTDVAVSPSSLPNSNRPLGAPAAIWNAWSSRPGALAFDPPPIEPGT
jgi:hypothetical protein